LAPPLFPLTFPTSGRARARVSFLFPLPPLVMDGEAPPSSPLFLLERGALLKTHLGRVQYLFFPSPTHSMGWRDVPLIFPPLTGVEIRKWPPPPPRTVPLSRILKSEMRRAFFFFFPLSFFRPQRKEVLNCLFLLPGRTTLAEARIDQSRTSPPVY